MPEIKIYFADIEALNSDAVFDSLYNSLSEERKAKADRLKTKRDKLLSVGAGALLQKALFLEGIEKCEVITAENGKPFLKNHPEIFFNLSHSENMIMCAVSDCEVGCDIEKIKETTNNIAKRYFTDIENKEIASASKRDEMFFRIWTLKESYMKALGLGFALSLGDFSIEISNRISAIHNGSRVEYSFIEISDIDGYCCSCCIKGNHEAINSEIKFIKLNA